MSELMLAERTAQNAFNPLKHQMPEDGWKPGLISGKNRKDLSKLILPAVLVLGYEQSPEALNLNPWLIGTLCAASAFIIERFFDQEKGKSNVSEDIGNAVMGFVLGTGAAHGINQISQAEGLNKILEGCQSLAPLAGAYIVFTKEGTKRAIARMASTGAAIAAKEKRRNQLTGRAMALREAAQTLASGARHDVVKDIKQQFPDLITSDGKHLSPLGDGLARAKTLAEAETIVGAYYTFSVVEENATSQDDADELPAITTKSRRQ